jgi:hypothetical protein
LLHPTYFGFKNDLPEKVSDLKKNIHPCLPVKMVQKYCTPLKEHAMKEKNFILK